jgi:cytochrome c
MNRNLAAASLALLAFAAAGCSYAVSGQKAGAERTAPALMVHYGCPTCHVIPNVPGAVGKVGPSLHSLAQSSYIAGVLPNTPKNLRQWIMHPQHFQPGTAMPDMGVTEQDAQKIQTFLESNP